MGFKADSTQRRRKTAPQKANPLQMLLIFIALGFSVWLGAWLPINVPLGDYAPIPANWYTPIFRTCRYGPSRSRSACWRSSCSSSSLC